MKNFYCNIVFNLIKYKYYSIKLNIFFYIKIFLKKMLLSIIKYQYSVYLQHINNH
jgi:hypothetical protein